MSSSPKSCAARTREKRTINCENASYSHMSSLLLAQQIPLAEEENCALEEVQHAAFADPFGDGDQSPILSIAGSSPQSDLNAQAEGAEASPMRVLSTVVLKGLDVYSPLGRQQERETFHLACFLGSASHVRQLIAAATKCVCGGEPKALTHLLEKRISLMRLTPLHYCAIGSRAVGNKETIAARDRQNGSLFRKFAHNVVAELDFTATECLRHEDVASILCGAGSRVDARNILGSTPLADALGPYANHISSKVASVLLSYGANPNSQNRLGDSTVLVAILDNNASGLRAMLQAGADVNAVSLDGSTPLQLIRKSPLLSKVLAEVQREHMLRIEKCGCCGNAGVRKYCSSCRKVFYCSRACQVTGWAEEHESGCGTTLDALHFVDIDLDRMMCASRPSQKQGRKLINPTTGMSSLKQMEVGKKGEGFIVKVELRGDPEGDQVVCVSEKNSDYLLVRKTGATAEAYDRLMKLVCKSRGTFGTVFVIAKWIILIGNAEEQCSGSVLRLDVSKVVPPPKSIW